MIRLGYCCINTELTKRGITTNRGMIRRTFDAKGLPYASQLALQNARDLNTILKWNRQHNIHVFRISSGIFPWATEYFVEDLPDFPDIKRELEIAGQYVLDTGMRVSAHPDHFVKLGSANPRVVNNSIADLETHSTVFDLMGLHGYQTPINIHVGMNFSEEVVDRWLAAYRRLSFNCQRRLVVENDDKPNAFSVLQLFTYLHGAEGIPITFDYFHHTFHSDGLSLADAANLAAGTWPTTPLFHYSEQHPDAAPRAHASFITKKIDTFDFVDLDVDVEAKAKEQAILRYRGLYE